jgi:hypothetical protein
MAEPQKKPAEVSEYVFPDEKDDSAAKNQVEEQEDDVDIEIVDDTPEKDRGFKPGVSGNIPDVSDDELAEYSSGVKKRIKELSFARHDERRAKEAALRERSELEQIVQRALDENKRLKEYVSNGEKVYAGTAKAAAQSRLDMAKSRYKEAHEAFDADALIAAQQELTSAQMDLMAAENFRPSSLQVPQEGVYAQPAASQQERPDELALRWQQRNQWFGADRRMTAHALVAHQELVESGVDPRSEEYYRRIDGDMRQQFPRFFEGQNSSAETTTQPHRKPATVVAPTARSRGAKKISLTQTQVDLAKKFGLSLEEYARQVSLLEMKNAT